MDIIDLGIDTSFDVSSYFNYGKFTVNDFIVETLTTGERLGGGSIETSRYVLTYGKTFLSKTYDASTGILTAKQHIEIGGQAWNSNYQSSTYWLRVHTYLLLH